MFTPTYHSGNPVTAYLEVCYGVELALILCNVLINNRLPVSYPENNPNPTPCNSIQEKELTHV